MSDQHTDRTTRTELRELRKEQIRLRTTLQNLQVFLGSWVFLMFLMPPETARRSMLFLAIALTLFVRAVLFFATDRNRRRRVAPAEGPSRE